METPANSISHPSRNEQSPEVVSAVRQRAQELYERSGRIPGHDVENWLQAEAEVKARFTADRVSGSQNTLTQPAVRYVKIKIKDVTYTGEYDPADAERYKPADFRAGCPVEVFFDGEFMILKRRTGEQLTTRIIGKERTGQ